MERNLPYKNPYAKGTESLCDAHLHLFHTLPEISSMH